MEIKKRVQDLVRGRVLARLLDFTTGLFKRKSLYQISFASGTNTWRECLMVLYSLLKLESVRDGKYIGMFEREIAEIIGTKYVFTYSAGRVALYSILKAIGVKEGDEVILPGFTCAVVPTAIIYAGARPVFADISRDDYSCNPQEVRAKITGRTKAIIAQHTYGIPCKIEALTKIARQNNLTLIEDCAHTFGVEYSGRKLGTFGDAAFFSTDSTKFISTFLGGIAVTNKPEIGERLREQYTAIPFLSRRDLLRIISQFIISNLMNDKRLYFLGRSIFDIYWYSGAYFFMQQDYSLSRRKPYPYPARMSNIQAKIGLSQLSNLVKNIQHRQTISAIYERKFDYRMYRGLPLLRYPLEVFNRDDWVGNLEPVVALENWFDSCAQGLQAPLAGIGYKRGDCPVAEEVSSQIINLPTHLKVTPGDAQKIIHRVNTRLLYGIVYGS